VTPFLFIAPVLTPTMPFDRRLVMSTARGQQGEKGKKEENGKDTGKEAPSTKCSCGYGSNESEQSGSEQTEQAISEEKFQTWLGWTGIGDMCAVVPRRRVTQVMRRLDEYVVGDENRTLWKDFAVLLSARQPRRFQAAETRGPLFSSEEDWIDLEELLNRIFPVGHKHEKIVESIMANYGHE